MRPLTANVFPMVENSPTFNSKSRYLETDPSGVILKKFSPSIPLLNGGGPKCETN